MGRSARANVVVYRLEVVNRSSLREEGAKLWGWLEDDRGNGLCKGPEVGPSLAGVYGTVRPVWLEPRKRGEWVGVGGAEREQSGQIPQGLVVKARTLLLL